MNLIDGIFPAEYKDTQQQPEYPIFKPELHKLETELRDFSMAHSEDKDEEGDPLFGAMYIRGLYSKNNGKLNTNIFLCGGQTVIEHALFEIIRSNDQVRKMIEDVLTLAKIESYEK